MIPNKIAFFLLITFSLAAGVAQADGDAEAGKAKAETCASCHGADGKGDDVNPPLAGLEQEFFVKELQAFKDGSRENPMMQMFASQLNDQDMADLAAYFATLKAD